MLLPRNKSRGKARQSVAAERGDTSEGVIASEMELEYDENASIDESGDSGSEFQASEESVEIEQQDEEYVAKPRKSPRKEILLDSDQDLEDENDDEIMLDAAIRESLQTARFDGAASNGAGPSSRPIASSNPAAALRAAAAERRLARANKAINVNDLDYALLNESEAKSTDDEALFNIRAKKKKTATIRDTTSTKFMSISERRKLNREKRKFDKAANRRGTKKEELAMMKELGRPLTLVRSVETVTHCI